MILEDICERLCVLDNLLDVGLELTSGRFIEVGGLASDIMHQRATLSARKDGFIDCLGVIFSAHDDSTVFGSDGLMSATGDEVSVLDGRWMSAATSPVIGVLAFEKGL